MDYSYNEKLREAYKDLTEFQRRFIEALAKNPNNYAEAARAAGSTSKNPNRVGWNTINEAPVQYAYGLLMRQRAEAASVDDTEIMNYLRNIYMRSMEQEDFKAANRAAELMGNALGMFKGEIKKSNTLTKVGDNMSYRETNLEISGEPTKETIDKRLEDITDLIEEIQGRPDTDQDDDLDSMTKETDAYLEDDQDDDLALY